MMQVDVLAHHESRGQVQTTGSRRPQVGARPTRSEWLMVALVALFSFTAAFRSDRVPVNNGYGWDGELYGSVAADPVRAARDGKLDGYYEQRILHSVAVHMALRSAQIDPTPKHIISAFEILNALLLILGAALWVAIARELQLEPASAWLGWLGLFVNFAIMRQASYYPVLTDVSAFVLGLAMLICYLRRRSVALAILMLVGGFVWPLASAIGLLLLAGPWAALPERREFGPIALLAAIGAGGATLALTGYLYFVKGVVWRPAMPEAIPISIVLAVVFASVCTLTMVRGLRFADLPALGRALRGRNILLALVALFATRVIQATLVSAGGSQYFRRMLRALGTLPVSKPFNFFVPHVIYFGPIILLLVFFWPTVTATVRRWGLGPVAVALLTIALALNSESRQAMLGFPLFVGAVAVAAQTRGWTWMGNAIVAVLGLLASKIWMPMPLRDEATTEASIASYPMQSYFMNHGPWITVHNYLLQAAAVGVAGAVLFAVIFWQRAGPTDKGRLVASSDTVDER